MNKLTPQHVMFLAISLVLSAIHFEYFFSGEGHTLLLSPAMTVFVAVVSSVILAVTDFFHPVRPYPRGSDAIIVVFTIMITCLVGERICVLFLQDQRLPLYSTIISISLSLGLSIFLLHYCMSKYVGQKYWKKSIVLYMPPLSSVRFIQSVAQLGVAEYVRFIRFDQYRAQLESGKLTAQADLIVWSDDAPKHYSEISPLLQSHLSGVAMADSTEILTNLSGRVSLSSFELWDYISEANDQSGAVKLFWRLKNIVEPILALMLLVVLAPLFILVAILVRLESKGPAIFSQLRMGHSGKSFTLYKFRSMCVDAEKDGPQWSAGKEDQRITALGKILRKTRLDELPQLINVCKGEMSFCGPRPERPEMYDKITEKVPYFWLRTLVKPGITGWAQIQAGYAATIEESGMKLEYDLFYIRNMSPRLDLVILIHTVLYALGFHKPRAQFEATAPSVVEVTPLQEKAA